MKKYLFFLTGAFLFVNTIATFAQNHYNIRLSPNEVAPLGKVCYDVQLASADGIDLNLAGQNYRLYYDANQLSFDESSSQLLLSKEKYTNFTIKDNLQNIDASGAGPIEFDQQLSFLNIGNDLKDEENGGIILPASGSWKSTANICFHLNEQEGQTEIRKDYSIFWARQALTESYATAYVEVVEWLNPDVTIPAKPAIFFDEEFSTSLEKEVENNSLSVYPNPTKDKVFIDYEGQVPFNIQVYSAIGQLVIEDKYPANTDQHSLNLVNLPAGIYQLRLSTDNQQIVKRVEKIH